MHNQLNQLAGKRPVDTKRLWLYVETKTLKLKNLLEHLFEAQYNINMRKQKNIREFS